MMMTSEVSPPEWGWSGPAHDVKVPEASGLFATYPDSEMEIVSMQQKDPVAEKTSQPH
jgi:hypothetical protein